MDAGSFAGLKALYSDARKRAGVAAGIGAYLYTSLEAVVLPIGPGDRQVQAIRRQGKSDLLVLSPETEQWLRHGYQTRMGTDAVRRDLGEILAHGEPENGIGQGEVADQAAQPTPPSSPPPRPASTAATATARSSPSTSATSDRRPREARRAQPARRPSGGGRLPARRPRAGRTRRAARPPDRRATRRPADRTGHRRGRGARPGRLPGPRPARPTHPPTTGAATASPGANDLGAARSRVASLPLPPPGRLRALTV